MFAFMPTFFLVDAFADRPLVSGNPAGVCVLREDADESWMQAVAAEINQAETAFLAPRGEGWGLRWFTPTVEVDLCGHATLAAACALWETGWTGVEIRFMTASGTLTARREAELIALDFPSEIGAEHLDRGDQWAAVCDVLGQAPKWLGRNRMDWLAELDTVDAVRALTPDMAGIAALGMRGLIVTAMDRSGQDEDYVCRFFAPQSGVPEDHVTGSAHCWLGPFWADRWAKSRVIGRQIGRRGGLVDVEPRGDRVTLRGRALITLRGELLI
jgi:predicted PhzF superfamily epimerase YddE/YHI9